jgi:hypothetical protein
MFTMSTITDNQGTARLMGYLYCGIAAITLLGGGFLQASLWACGAGIWFVTSGKEQQPLPPGRQLMANAFAVAFVVVLFFYALMLYRNWR